MHRVNLASSRLPLPLGEGQASHRVTNLPLTTKLSREQALGMLWRNYPPHSIQTNFMRLAQATEPSNPNRLHVVLGPRGAGKSTAAKLLGQLRGIPVTELDCGDKNLTELLFTTEITEQSKPIIEAINDKLLHPSTDPASKAIAVQELGDLVNPETGTIDAASIEHINPEKVAEVTARINRVQNLLGLVPDAKNLGIKIVPGELINTARAGGFLVLNELNRGNNTNALHEVLRLVAGEIDELKVSRGNCEVNLNRADFGNFTCILTGNEAREELGVKLLPASLVDRAGGNVQKVDVVAPEKDTAQLICMQLTGLPLTAMQDAYGTLPPSAFLKQMLTLGLSPKEQQYQIKPQWVRNLDRSQEICQAATQLGRYYAESAALVNDDTKNHGLDGRTTEFFG